MKKYFRKTVSIMLAVLIALCSSAVAFAAETVTPVIIISGMNAHPLYLEDGTSAFPPDQNRIIKNVPSIVLPAVGSIAKNDWSIFAEKGLDPIGNVFEPISCDENGDSVYNVKAKTYPGSAANHKEQFADGTRTESAVIRAISEKIGWENTYYYHYDWRMNPLDLADELDEIVRLALSESASSKVSLVSLSFGGMILSSYIYKYGSEHIKNAVYGSTGFNGVELVGQMFTGAVDINTGDILNYLTSSAKEHDFLSAMLSLGTYGITTYAGGVQSYVDDYIDNIKMAILDKTYEDIFARTFAHFQGIWCLMPFEYYEQAKQYMAKSAVLSESFLKATDEYFYNVQTQNKKMFDEIMENGVNVYITSAYGFSGMPFTSDCSSQTDNLIDTYHMSGNATVAPYGKKLDTASYSHDGSCTEPTHCHLSLDGEVDASVAMFPEQTWFIKNMGHVEFRINDDSNALLVFLATSEKRVDVRSDDRYPQFVELDIETGKFISLTKDVTLNEKDGFRFVDFALKLIAFFEKVRIYVGK